jgi:hypothetical protein
MSDQSDAQAALDAAVQRIARTATRARMNGYTQPIEITFTIPELRALDARLKALEDRERAHIAGG